MLMRFRGLAVLVLLLVPALPATAQSMEDCTAMANRWSDTFTNGRTLEEMTNLFLPNALVFGTGSVELATTTADVAAYFRPAFSRAARSRNVVKSQSAIQVADTVWVIAGLYEFVSQREDGTSNVTPARFHFVVVRRDSQCRIAAFNSSRLPN